MRPFTLSLFDSCMSGWMVQAPVEVKGAPRKAGGLDCDVVMYPIYRHLSFCRCRNYFNARYS